MLLSPSARSGSNLSCPAAENSYLGHTYFRLRNPVLHVGYLQTELEKLSVICKSRGGGMDTLGAVGAPNEDPKCETVKAHYYLTQIMTHSISFLWFWL